MYSMADCTDLYRRHYLIRLEQEARTLDDLEQNVSKSWKVAIPRVQSCRINGLSL
jgi:hypothetical protein